MKATRKFFSFGENERDHYKRIQRYMDALVVIMGYRDNQKYLYRKQYRSLLNNILHRKTTA